MIVHVKNTSGIRPRINKAEAAVAYDAWLGSMKRRSPRTAKRIEYLRTRHA